MHYILTYAGTEQPNREFLEHLIKRYHIQVIDGNDLPQMALIDIDETDYKPFSAALNKEWKLSPIKTYKIPTTKRSIRRKGR